jgi:hypothetical protein
VAVRVAEEEDQEVVAVVAAVDRAAGQEEVRVVDRAAGQEEVRAEGQEEVRAEGQEEVRAEGQEEVRVVERHRATQERSCLYSPGIRHQYHHFANCHLLPLGY